MVGSSRRIVRSFSAALATCVASAAAFAWGLEIDTPDQMPDFVDMTRQIDFIGQWSYDRDGEAIVVEVDSCGDDLCVRRVMPSGVCAPPMMVVRENKSVPRENAMDVNSWRFSGKMTWVDGAKYDMQVEVIDAKFRHDGKRPDKADQELVFDGGPSSVARDAWDGGRVYPVQFLLVYKGKPTCSAAS